MFVAAKKSHYPLLFAATSFIVSLFVNLTALQHPFNGHSLGQVANKYANLCMPANFTFSIWGIIYILLGIFLAYVIGSQPYGKHKTRINSILLWFGKANILNAAWLIAWQYQLIPVSFVIIVCLLLCLAVITNKTRHITDTNKLTLALHIPFSFYFGWVSMATVLNGMALLAYFGATSASSLYEPQTVIVLVISALAGLLMMVRNTSPIYILPFAWGYFGLIIEHMTAHNGLYYHIVFASVLMLGTFLFGSGLMITHRLQPEWRHSATRQQ